MASIELFESEILSDLTLNLVNSVNDEQKVTLRVHKAILFVGCLYFRSMFSKFSEQTASEITIEVIDTDIASDIIKSFYGISTENPTDWKTILNKHQCQVFFGLEVELPSDIRVPESDFEEFLDSIEKFGYTDRVIRLIISNLPKNYDMIKFPKDFLREVYDITNDYQIVILSGYSCLEIYDKDFNLHRLENLEGLIINRLYRSTQTNCIIFSSKKDVLIYNLKSNETQKLITSQKKIISNLQTEDFIYTQSKNTIGMYNPISNNLVNSFSCCEISHMSCYQNKIAITHSKNYSLGQKICIYSICTNKLLNKFKTDRRICPIKFCPNKYILAFGNEISIQNFNTVLWNVEKNEFKSCPFSTGSEEIILGIEWTIDGNYVMSCCESAMIYVHSIDGELINTIDMYQHPSLSEYLVTKDSSSVITKNSCITLSNVSVITDDLILVQTYNHNKRDNKLFLVNIFTGEFITEYPCSHKNFSFIGVPSANYDLNLKIKKALNNLN